jgi:dihydrofolate synthase/folylpolyglutamate synthase
MSYKSTTEYLYGLQKYGMKFGLDNITKLLSALGNPQNSFRSIHVAGTNGKGSTSAMIEAILRTGGVRTGLFTSPHLVSFTERIRINGEEIEERDVIEAADEVRSIAISREDFYPTFFEVVTAMAFLHFRKMKVNWAIVEVGMGGRLDATNLIMPEAAVITSIGYDHHEFLGRTLKEITGEKTGIIKDKVPVVTADQRPEVMEVIKYSASEKNSSLFKYKSDFSSEMVSDEPEGISFNFYGSSEYRDIKLPLSGEHQLVNASVAIKATEIISDRYPQIAFNIKRGLENTKCPGRLEILKEEPPVLIDGAHNVSAAYVLARYLKKILGSKYGRLILVIGIMNDKEIDAILEQLLPLSSEIIFTSPSYGRAASPDLLAARASRSGYYSRKALGVSDAINLAEELYMPGDLILVTGSFYTIGEAKEAIGCTGVFSRLRE